MTRDKDASTEEVVERLRRCRDFFTDVRTESAAMTGAIRRLAEQEVEIEQFRAERAAALRAAYDLTPECQTIGEAVTDLVRIAREARVRRDEWEQRFENARRLFESADKHAHEYSSKISDLERELVWRRRDMDKIVANAAEVSSEDTAVDVALDLLHMLRTAREQRDVAEAEVKMRAQLPYARCPSVDARGGQCRMREGHVGSHCAVGGAINWHNEDDRTAPKAVDAAKVVDDLARLRAVLTAARHFVVAYHDNCYGGALARLMSEVEGCADIRGRE